MYVVLLILFVSNFFTPIFAMNEAVLHPFHAIVKSVDKGNYNAETAEEKIEKLCKNDKDINGVDGERTAVKLSVDYFIYHTHYSEDQLKIFEILLKKSKPDEKNSIREFLDKENLALATNLTGLKRRPFQVAKVWGGGSFIVEDDDDDRERKIETILSRIDQAKKVIK